MKIKIISVNKSEKKGTVKKPQEYICLCKTGVEGDAHAGLWHRQVSMLAMESIRKFSKQSNRTIEYGDFAENITTEGKLLHEAHPFDRFVGEYVELEVTQIGKKCHGSNCSIFQEVGNCVMPKEGIFARVLKSGKIRAGHELLYIPKVWKAQIITLSDRASRGKYKDKSGPALEKLIQKHFNQQNRKVETSVLIIPDDEVVLKKSITQAIDAGCDMIFTTGGTGVGPRDITPDVVRKLIDKEIPGIMEHIRVKYGMHIPNALLSRGIAGTIGQMQVYTLPGSPKAVKEYCAEIFKTLDHVFLMMAGIDGH